jgi:hypothetical protein
VCEGAAARGGAARRAGDRPLRPPLAPLVVSARLATASLSFIPTLTGAAEQITIWKTSPSARAD